MPNCAKRLRKLPGYESKMSKNEVSLRHSIPVNLFRRTLLSVVNRNSLYDEASSHHLYGRQGRGPEMRIGGTRSLQERVTRRHLLKRERLEWHKETNPLFAINRPRDPADATARESLRGVEVQYGRKNFSTEGPIKS
ncbi:hypothetical protein G5I_03717 [Acromyrmex echinatior]|uniref:Uncharacterized protein n=1 Tax=Acromyrmex echinatior TaxID=103372 RepID=F4WDQ9_ACREC|nr:hypothetical protein G5I_03717 [Acromyrmex echinatior]